ncbi:tRNA lysidine(34) synthetase TilS [Cyclobacterium jeungdonense]|uniref:tRNA(Ile)-lysidine synthase n=1 Tax=Cyclobacterium jeungdonense TaxID=708087 RepID=A0ABT8C464_9BACT|nr:tRNA lysidine(34) synthetase TilS [Cyclobacterium jeungdonense]MDN3687096.1 tRNA lysidine(34) synthetase TilS [Cyclobacterium jeungdonense]
MLRRFIQHVRENNILDVKNRYLLAISGGIDSVVLAHLMYRAGFKFSFLHCNFQLRGEESDADEAFVRQLAQRLGCAIHVKFFEPQTYMKAQGVSLQMAARELRYDWFEQMNRDNQTDGVVVAHHADDQLETILLNLLRGTGIEGLYGMAERRGCIIRPLLPFSRAAIQEYLRNESLDWREDSSNLKTIYKRNFIRHELFPLLEKFDPKGPELMSYSFERVKDTGKAFFYFFEQWLGEHVVQVSSYEYLDFKSLEGVPGKTSLLFYWLRPRGFVYAQVKEMAQVMANPESGKCFFSERWMVNIDRERLILGKKRSDKVSLSVESHAISFRTDDQTGYEIIHLKEGWQVDRSSENALLDRQLLEYPLLIRTWEQGDKFRPLGMGQFKKVSDFLIDSKIPVILKERVQVLCSAGEIVWVIGHRIDDRYKVTESTEEVVYFKKNDNV